MYTLWVFILAQFQATFALTLCKLVQLCTSIFALACVGINHQKGGDWPSFVIFKANEFETH